MSDKYTITIEWENDATFEMKSKLNEEDAITVIKCDENTHFGDLKTHIEAICNDYFARKVTDACNAMLG